jgi:hypothetical protein
MDRAGKIYRDESLLFVKPKQFEWLPVRVQMARSPDGSGVILKSDGYTKYVEIRSRGIGVRFEDNFFDLFPQEERRIRVEAGEKGWRLEELSIFTIQDSFL